MIPTLLNRIATVLAWIFCSGGSGVILATAFGDGELAITLLGPTLFVLAAALTATGAAWVIDTRTHARPLAARDTTPADLSGREAVDADEDGKTDVLDPDLDSADVDLSNYYSGTLKIAR